MTRIRTGGIFRTHASGPVAARVTMTVVAIRAAFYSVVRCPNCSRRIMDVPGKPLILARVVESASGRGRVVSCKRCKSLVEVIEYEQ